MTVTSFPLGAIGTNCYLVYGDDQVAALIDPGDQPDAVLSQIAAAGVTVRAILLTHGHYDHTTAVHPLVEALGAVAVYIHEADVNKDETCPDPLRFFPQDGCNYYAEGDTITVGSLDFSVLHTPGHSPGSVTLRGGDTLFTGDTLFKGSMGRTDLPGGDDAAIFASLKRLGNLPGDLSVRPGHMGASTLARERQGNYYLQRAMGGQ
ncbi:MAG: MBL fold metallo-hydrolase [Oscillospiraceae bacterium]